MITINDNWNVGQFNLDITVNADDAMLTILQRLGVRWLGQRVTEVDKILGAFTTVDGKQVRDGSFRRNNVAFTAELAEKLANDAFSSLSIPDDISGGKDVKLAAIAVVGEKVDGGKAPKFAEEKAILARHTTDGAIELDWVRDVVGYAGDEVSADSDALLKAIKAYKIAALKGL